MYPEPTQVVPAATRTPAQWVEYYLQIEDAVLQGKDVTLDNGNRVVMEDLDKIRRARADWERRAATQANRGVQNFGGFRYRTPDMTQ
jgi:hypothetical protein